MAETGNPSTPPILRGAIIQLMEDLGAIIPNIIPFQYNPEKMTRGLMPWNPFEVDQTNRGAQAPMVQPYDPEETYQFSLELDATNDLEEGDPIAMASGVASRIAAIKKLTEPSQGLFGDLIASAQALVGAGVEARMTRPSIPVSLLVMGPGLILPVRITSISIEVTEFTPTLYPHMATVTLNLRVLTPEVFKCRTTAATDLAIAAYQFTRLQEDALAVLNITNAAKATLSMLPF